MHFNSLLNAVDNFFPRIIQNGKMGTVAFNDLETMLMAEDDATAVFETVTGEMTAPVQGYSGWMIFRADSDAAAADTADASVLSDIKRYISVNDSETMSAFVEAKADEIYAAAAEDFDAATAEYNLTVTDVNPSSYNPAQSSFINGLAGNDPEGLLYNAATADTAFQEELYRAADNTVLGPVSAGSSYIIVRPVAGGIPNANWTNYLDMMYIASSGTLAAQDLESSILSSDAFEDNFITTFLTDVMNISAQ